MAARTKTAKATAQKAGKAAAGARTNPYVQRFIEDPDLRDNVRQAFDHAKQAYRRMSNGKAPTKALMEDKKLQRELREASHSFKEAADQLRGKRRKRRGRKRRLLSLLIVAGVIAMFLSEDLRKNVLDRLFGSEEEFEYTSTTSPA
jgi:type IV secretory pathway VirB10-like protein